MDQKRITDYINSLDQGHGVLCDKIAKEARAAAVPIIRRETGALLQTLTAAVKPMRILEVGTAVGYSALLMAQSMPSGAHITTIEKSAQDCGCKGEFPAGRDGRRNYPDGGRCR